MRNLGNIKILTGASLQVVLADDTQLTIDSEHISLNGIVLDNATSMDGQFTIGAAVTGQLTITILNEDGLYSPYNFRDATCQLTFYGVAEIPDDEEEEIQEGSLLIGSYNIVDYTYDGANITLTAYDNLSLFDFPCTETRGETIAFPISLTALVQTAARICGVTLASQSAPIPNGSYTVAQQPEGWDTMTWHDVVAYCAQLGGVYAKVDQYGRVLFDWYSINALPQGYDGGTFDTTDTPYSDGDTLNGGDFSYDGTEDTADGGTFNYPANMHIIGSPYSLTIDTDDVAITGLKVVLATADNINADENTQDYTTALYGTDGYVITISGNPFIQTTAQADAIKDFLGAVVTGLWFRPLNATIDDDLSIEAGDQAYITGVDGDTYQCFISHVTYTTYAATTIACDAEPNKSSEKTRFTASDKLAVHVAGIKKRLEGVSKIAGNTNQYFWHTETGTDTGAHITEVPKEEWDDPNSQNYHSGGNLLARSNGIAVRDGLTELATFSSDGMCFYDQYGAKTMDVDTNGVSQTFERFIEASNTAIPNEPLVFTITDPYFCNFTGRYELRIQVNGHEHEVYYPWTADFTESWVSDYGPVTAAYSYANKTITVTYTGSETSVFIWISVQWAANIVSSTFSFGALSKSTGAYSGVMGFGLKTEYENQFAIGKFNRNNSDNVFEVGNGEGDDVRYNVFSISRDGDTFSEAVPVEGTLTTPITNGSTYRNRCTRKCNVVNVTFHRANFTARNPSDVIAYLPTGFAPTIDQYIPGIIYSNGWIPTTMVVKNDGRIYAAYAPASTCTHVQIVGTFII